MPQVLVNYQRKSTVGWSIDQILLDFAGGILSIAQLVLDSSLQQDWSGIMGNPIKLGLGNVSIAFDLVFFLQHFVLYREARLLADGADDDVDGLLAADGGIPSLASSFASLGEGVRRPLLETGLDEERGSGRRLD